MSRVLSALAHRARWQPEHLALSGRRELSYRQLHDEVLQLASRFRQQQPAAIGLLLPNDPAWVTVDLAAIASGCTLVPLPDFFSDRQLAHIIDSAGIDHIITDQPDRLRALANSDRKIHIGTLDIAGLPVSQLLISAAPARGIRCRPAKVTYTSGTTGDPKGVCLRQTAMEQVAVSLQQVTAMSDKDRHLCLMPFATLLENIAGIYVPLLAGCCCHLLSDSEKGTNGVTRFDAAMLLQGIEHTRATTIILTPQLLQAMTRALSQGLAPPRSLRFAAVGGAPVSPVLLDEAHAMGLYVYEGYGLSECASVVSLNTPARHRPGSVGRPLPHVRLRITDAGEIEAAGAVFDGYLHNQDREGAGQSEHVATGDLGFLDDEGYLHLTGRRKNMYITSYGRNVSPEWIECELQRHAGIRQACIHGEGRPWSTAIIVPASGADQSLIEEAVHKTNLGLPHYAQIGAWIAADRPFTPQNHQLTQTGRLRRRQIEKAYAVRISRQYVNPTPYEEAN